MQEHTKLDAWHEGDHGERIDHDASTLTKTPPRRFVSRWIEGGRRMEISIEDRGGLFAGEIRYPDEKSWKPDSASAEIVTLDGGWDVRVDWRTVDERHHFTIHAQPKPIDDVQIEPAVGETRCAT